MMITEPYPAELIRIARKLVWYDAPEETLQDLKTFLSHLMVYGSPADLAVVDVYVPPDEFRKVLEDAPAGVFTAEAWALWHQRLGNCRHSTSAAAPLPRCDFWPRAGHLSLAPESRSCAHG
jgi:hypothetical protein